MAFASPTNGTILGEIQKAMFDGVAQFSDLRVYGLKGNHVVLVTQEGNPAALGLTSLLTLEASVDVNPCEGNNMVPALVAESAFPACVPCTLSFHT